LNDWFEARRGSIFFLDDGLKFQYSLLRALSLFGALMFSAAHAQTQSIQSPIQLALIEGLSGPFANTGEAVHRNLVWAVERVNARGGVKTTAGLRPLALQRYDSKGQNEEALSVFRAAQDDGAQFVLQGNSSSNAAALLDAINKHNEREPSKRVLFLNYSAVDPALTNEKCSFWHFRFDAHADMRMGALMQVLKQDKVVRTVYLIGQDYSFGQAVLREAHIQLGLQRPDVKVVGEELHPVGRVKDFLPYAAKIKASGAQAVITGNWGNDLTLLVKAAREAGYEGKFYTFYGNALGAPAALGDAGVGKVLAVAEWLPNVPGVASEAFVHAFHQRFPKPTDDYLHLRMQMMIEALVQAIEKAGTSEPQVVALQLEKAQVSMAGQTGRMRAVDHQFQQPLVVGLMAKQGDKGVKFDVEGSGYGFKVIRQLSAEQVSRPTTCTMVRPG
jgi:branched-chain amino acid transport system substrate-binding protein